MTIDLPALPCAALVIFWVDPKTRHVQNGPDEFERLRKRAPPHNTCCVDEIPRLRPGARPRGLQIPLDRAGSLKPDILALLRLIEETVPVQRIWLDTAEDKETPRTGFARAPDGEVMETLSSIFDALVKFRGLSPTEARERLGRTPPFDRHLDLVSALEVKDTE